MRIGTDVPDDVVILRKNCWNLSQLEEMIKLKIYSIAIACILIPTSAVAGNDWRSTCKLISSLAETVMVNRQNGVSMVKMMETAKGAVKDMTETLIMSAYDKPRFSTDEMQKRSVEDFRDQAYLECIKAIPEK